MQGAIENSQRIGVMAMNGLSKASSSWLIRTMLICMVIGIAVFTAARLAAQDANKKPWDMPDAAKIVKNPVTATPETIAAAAKMYVDDCSTCHGEKGKGDGFAAGASSIPPANFTDAKLMGSETDGALFWKMSEGRGVMPAWKDILSETERWQLVNYLRKLYKDANSGDAAGAKGGEKLTQ
jgi:mono/diheme cytochrome c family protein